MGTPLIVDTREPHDLWDLIKEAATENRIPVERQMLGVGDFMFLDHVEDLNLVTRKSSDLFDSLYSGHFQDELERCINAINAWGSGKLWWLQEGPWTSGGGGNLMYFKRSGLEWFRSTAMKSGNPRTFPALQISLQSVGGMFLWTASQKDTVHALVSLYKRGQEGWPSKFTTSPSRPPLRWTTDSRVRHLMGLWPHLREQVALDLLAKFGSIRAILAASPKELKTVKGLGANGIKNLKEVMDG